MIITVMLLAFKPYLAISWALNPNSIPIPQGSTLNFTVNLNKVQEARASNIQ